MVNKDNYLNILNQIGPNTKLIAVSKTKPIEDIQALYDLGQRDFGENRVQELVEKQALLPQNIRWHLIGHLQTNKVKQVLPFVYMIHSIDSIKLMEEIQKQAQLLNIPKVRILLQIFIAQEETKTGFSITELDEMLINRIQTYTHLEINGLMGIATHTENESIIQNEYAHIEKIFNDLKPNFKTSFKELSIGMSSDYTIAMNFGTTYIRVGSLLFGERNKI